MYCYEIKFFVIKLGRSIKIIFLLFIPPNQMMKCIQGGAIHIELCYEVMP